MTNKIDELVEEVLPDAQERVRDHDRALLKRAIEQRKLCKPMSESEIMDELINRNMDEWNYQSKVASAIHAKQFKERA